MGNYDICLDFFSKLSHIPFFHVVVYGGNILEFITENSISYKIIFNLIYPYSHNSSHFFGINNSREEMR